MTPGPWTVRKNVAGWYVDNKDGVPIVRLTANYGATVVASNARAIAAVPDLLAALQMAVTMIDECAWGDRHKVAEAAEHAIAKATGES